MDLFFCVKNNHLEHVKLLVEQGADKDEGDSHGQTLLLWASFHGHLEVTQYLVEQGATLDKASNSDLTPLHVATSSGHLEICRYLLEQGADRNKVDNDGKAPLHKAAQRGNLEIAMLLMSYGADLNARTNTGDLPIDYTWKEEIKQAIRNEPRRRMDGAPGKRATEEDRHSHAAISAGRRRGRAEQQATSSQCRGSRGSCKRGNHGR